VDLHEPDGIDNTVFIPPDEIMPFGEIQLGKYTYKTPAAARKTLLHTFGPRYVEPRLPVGDVVIVVWFKIGTD